MYIICRVNADRCKQFLATDQKWYVATNHALEFPSAKAASDFYMGSNETEGLDSCVWIEGPRGGHYTVGQISVRQTFVEKLKKIKTGSM